MKILHLNHHGTHTGGVEGYIADTSAALGRAGHQAHLVYFAPEGAGDLIPGTTHAPLSQWPRPADRAIRVLERVLDDFCPDVAYVHAVYHPDLVRWVGQQLPAVGYVHGPYIVCPGSALYLRRQMGACPHRSGPICLVNAQLEDCCWGRNPLVHLRLLRCSRAFVAAYRALGAILVGSSFMQQLLSRNGIASDRVHLLPPVLNPEPMPEAVFAQDSQTVLYAGRLTPEKGIRLLIEALARVQTDWQLVIAGAGEERGPCEALIAEQELEERVRFTGWLSGSEMAARLAQCACVAVPSLWPEPFGRVGPEAFLRGLPVVAFNSGGIGDWLEDGVTGYLVTSGDCSALGRRLELLLESPALRFEMGQRARKYALSAWKAEDHVGRLLQIFRQAGAGW
jgi:glycosyltransferase involved in cell wall biosynthesis